MINESQYPDIRPLPVVTNFAAGAGPIIIPPSHPPVSDKKNVLTLVKKEQHANQRNYRFYLVLYVLYFGSVSVLVAISSILVFVASSLDGQTDYQTIRNINITVGILTIIIEFVNTLANGFEIQNRKSSFKKSLIENKELENELLNPTTHPEKFYRSKEKIDKRRGYKCVV